MFTDLNSFFAKKLQKAKTPHIYVYTAGHQQLSHNNEARTCSLKASSSLNKCTFFMYTCSYTYISDRCQQLPYTEIMDQQPER